MSGNQLIQIDKITKSFTVGKQEVLVLKGVSFDILKGEFTVIFGPSGCGKSTLLHTILGLEEPSTGLVKVIDYDVYSNTTEDERSVFRKKHVGLIFQQPNWVKAFNVWENVAFPLLLVGINRNEAYKKSLDSLKNVGMMDWADYVPTELSSGQQQKIALARALITDPEIIIADEPTGNLDFKSGEEVMKMLSMLNKTIIMVTHDLEYIKYATKALEIFDGNLVKIYTGEDLNKLSSSVKLKRGNDNQSVNSLVPNETINKL